MQNNFGTVNYPSGGVVSGASVKVLNFPSGTLATIYGSNSQLVGAQIANPIVASALGFYSFFAPSGHYALVISGAGLTSYTVNDVFLFDPLDSTSQVINQIGDVTSSVAGAAFSGVAGTTLTSTKAGFTLQVAASPSTDANSGSFTLNAGTGAINGGGINFSAGAGSLSTGTGGTINFIAGSALTAGGINFTAGSTGSVAGFLNPIIFTGGSCGSANGAGGAIRFIGGSPGLGFGNGGSIVLNPSAATGGAVSGSVIIQDGTAIPAGGKLNVSLTFTSTPGWGIYPGSGVPTISAAKGSLYLRSDGTTNTTRMYVATDSAGTWTAVNTVA